MGADIECNQCVFQSFDDVGSGCPSRRVLLSDGAAQIPCMLLTTLNGVRGDAEAC